MTFPRSVASLGGLWLLAGVGLGLGGILQVQRRAERRGPGGVRTYGAQTAPLARTSGAVCRGGGRAGDDRPGVLMERASTGGRRLQFQGARGAPGGGFRPIQVLAMALGQIAYLLPWIFAPLIAGLAVGLASAGSDGGRDCCWLCLALPPIVLFTITPFWGARGLPQWTMPGWFFAFPLMGAWLDERAVDIRGLAPLGLHLVRSAGGRRSCGGPARASTGWLGAP